MNAKHLVALACAAAVAASGTTTGAMAQQAPGSSRLHSASTEQARAAGIQMIARSFHLSPQAAASRMNIEEHVPAIVERVRAQYADRLAGVYLEHQPTHRLVVRLIGGGLVPSEFHQFGTDQLEVMFQPGADHTLAELQQRLDGGFPGLKQRLPGLQSGYVDERTGQIVLEVVSDPKAAISHAATQVVAERQLADAMLGVVTRIVPMGALVNQAIKGSGNLDFTNMGTPTQCTGAFTVKSVATPVTYGLLTAGHCQSTSGSFTYTDAGTTTPTTALTFVAAKYDAASDISWVSVSTNPADAVKSFYNGSMFVTPTTRLTKAGTSVGMSLCHYGRSASSSSGVCGTVASTAYNPGSICGPSGSNSCSATYVAVDVPTSTPCQQIDSGGPWFVFPSRPAGIHKAGDTLTGRCVYTSTDDIFGGTLNLQLL